MTPERPEGLTVALQVIEVFEALGIEYHLGGSYASSIHGVPRQTQDVDLVARLRIGDAAPLVEALDEAFYADRESAEGAIRRRASFNLVHLATGVKIDIFCLGESPFDRSEFERAIVADIPSEAPLRVRVKSAEDTILRKLDWFRSGGEISDRQWGDVIGCLRAQHGRLDLAYLDRWAKELGISDLLERALAEAEE